MSATVDEVPMFEIECNECSEWRSSADAAEVAAFIAEHAEKHV